MAGKLAPHGGPPGVGDLVVGIDGSEGAEAALRWAIAEAHNGTIKVRNLPGHGCVFTLDLPAA